MSMTTDEKEFMELLRERLYEFGDEWLKNDSRYNDYNDVFSDFKGDFFNKFPVYEELYEEGHDLEGYIFDWMDYVLHQKQEYRELNDLMCL